MPVEEADVDIAAEKARWLALLGTRGGLKRRKGIREKFASAR